MGVFRPSRRQASSQNGILTFPQFKCRNIINDNNASMKFHTRQHSRRTGFLVFNKRTKCAVYAHILWELQKLLPPGKFSTKCSRKQLQIGPHSFVISAPKRTEPNWTESHSRYHTLWHYRENNPELHTASSRLRTLEILAHPAPWNLGYKHWFVNFWKCRSVVVLFSGVAFLMARWRVVGAILYSGFWVGGVSGVLAVGCWRLCVPKY